MDEEYLISLVERYDELYNTGNPYYHDDKRRCFIWDDIGRQMNENPVECKEKWKKIRENYRKANILRLSRSGPGKKLLKPAKYAKALRFLMPHIQTETTQYLTERLSSGDEEKNVSITTPTRTRSSIKPKFNSDRLQQSIKKPIYHDEDDDEDDDDDKVISITSHVSPSPNQSSTNKKIKTSTSTSWQSLLQTYIEKKYERQDQNDPVVDFFKSLGQTVKNFPPDLQLRVKKDVFNIVSEAEEEMIAIDVQTT